MRESLGGSLLLNIVIIVVGLIITVFGSILSYSKAYRVKNSVIEIIERSAGYSVSPNVAVSEINSALKNYGYNSSKPSESRCKSAKERLELGDRLVFDNLNTSGYNYCVFKVCEETETERGVEKCKSGAGSYYIVVTFTEFRIPMIDSFLNFPVYGETQKIGKIYNY